MALLPLAVAVAAGVVVGSVLWAICFLLFGAAASLAACNARSRSQPPLCSWEEVEEGFARELRRARRRRILLGDPRLTDDGATRSVHDLHSRRH